METMKAAVLVGPRKIEVQEKEIPSVGPNEVLVNVKAHLQHPWRHRMTGF